MSKLSQYSELPVSIRLTETGQEITFVARPKGSTHHVSGFVGAETFEGFITLDVIPTVHPDVRWDVRLSLCVPAEAVALEKVEAAPTKPKKAEKSVVLDVDGAPATEQITEYTENERFILDGIRVDPFEQTREIQDAMPESTKPPRPGEEEELEKLAWDVRASTIEDAEEESIPQEDFSVSELPPSIGEEEELSEKIAAKAAARGRRPKR